MTTFSKRRPEAPRDTKSRVHDVPAAASPAALAMVALAAIVAVPSQSSAKEVQWRFAGTVTSVSGERAQAEASIGHTVRGSIVFDLDEPPLVLGSEPAGCFAGFIRPPCFANAIKSISFRILPPGPPSPDDDAALLAAADPFRGSGPDPRDAGCCNVGGFSEGSGLALNAFMNTLRTRVLPPEIDDVDLRLELDGGGFALGERLPAIPPRLDDLAVKRGQILGFTDAGGNSDDVISFELTELQAIACGGEAFPGSLKGLDLGPGPDVVETVSPLDGTRSVGIVAAFVPNRCSLDEVATALHFDHFNWLSLIVRDDGIAACLDGTDAPSACDGLRTRDGSLPKVPLADPPPGGYRYQAADCGLVNQDGTFPSVQDDLPMYHDEFFAFTEDRDCEGPAAIEDPDIARISENGLLFQDGPSAPDGLVTEFCTFLVGVRRDLSAAEVATIVDAPELNFNWRYTGGPGGGDVHLRANTDLTRGDDGVVSVTGFIDGTSNCLGSPSPPPIPPPPPPPPIERVGLLVRADCGDSNLNGFLDPDDVRTLESALLADGPVPVAVRAKCDVQGAADGCDLADLVVTERALVAPGLAPGLAPTCEERTEEFRPRLLEWNAQSSRSGGTVVDRFDDGIVPGDPLDGGATEPVCGAFQDGDEVDGALVFQRPGLRQLVCENRQVARLPLVELGEVSSTATFALQVPGADQRFALTVGNGRPEIDPRADAAQLTITATDEAVNVVLVDEQGRLIALVPAGIGAPATLAEAERTLDLRVELVAAGDVLLPRAAYRVCSPACDGSEPFTELLNARVLEAATGIQIRNSSPDDGALDAAEPHLFTTSAQFGP